MIIMDLKLDDLDCFRDFWSMKDCEFIYWKGNFIFNDQSVILDNAQFRYIGFTST